MDMSEMKYQLGLYTQMVEGARTPEDKERFTNMVNVWKGMIAKAEAIALAKKNSPEQMEKREKRLKKNVENLGIEFSAWENWAHNLYEIKKQENGIYKVKSKARDWLEEMTWDTDSDIGAQEKIYQLVRYKIYDRKRDRGDVLRDLGLIQ